MALDDFITHSHYPQEKIVWAYEGIVDNTNPYWNPVWDYGLFVPIPDGLHAGTLLIDGIWSTDDFVTSYPINAKGRVYGWIEEDSSYYENVDLVSANTMESFLDIIDYPSVYVQPQVDTSRTAKVRLWAYITASDSVSYVETATASDLAHDLQKTTNLAQLNMISENELTVPDGGTRVIHHNLGFRPFCRIWKQNPNGGWGKISSRGSIVSSQPEYDEIIMIDRSNIDIQFFDNTGQGESQKYIVRIYNYAIPE